MGELIQGRYGHNVIEIQGRDGTFSIFQNIQISTIGDFLVIGGEGNKLTERCQDENGQISCTQQRPGLNYYVYYPELVAVSDDFCL